MRKYFALFIAITILLSSCTPDKNNTNKQIVEDDVNSKIDNIEKEAPLLNSDATMLKARSMNWGELNENDDYEKTSVYILSYLGELKFHQVYNHSGIKNEKETKISEEDLKTIYDLLNTKVQTEKNYDGADGTGWNIDFYDENSKVIYNHRGYIYGSHKEEIIKLLDSYLNQS